MCRRYHFQEKTQEVLNSSHDCNSVMSIDILDHRYFSIFMFTDDLAYQRLPDSVKHYSVQQHIIDNKKKVNT
jgi:hypothetical protein